MEGPPPAQEPGVSQAHIGGITTATKAKPGGAVKEKEKSDTAKRPSGPGTLSPAAQRALAEAAERREVRQQASPPKEVGGREGLDPTRYGDWEINGIARDF
jgi:hypothetical protein